MGVKVFVEEIKNQRFNPALVLLTVGILTGPVCRYINGCVICLSLFLRAITLYSHVILIPYLCVLISEVKEKNEGFKVENDEHATKEGEWSTVCR